MSFGYCYSRASFLTSRNHVSFTSCQRKIGNSLCDIALTGLSRGRVYPPVRYFSGEYGQRSTLNGDIELTCAMANGSGHALHAHYPSINKRRILLAFCPAFSNVLVAAVASPRYVDESRTSSCRRCRRDRRPAIRASLSLPVESPAEYSFHCRRGARKRASRRR